MSDIVLNDGERIDDLQLNGLKIIQRKDKFCFGIDAVLLSDYTVVKKDENVFDIGTGTGVIPILLTEKSEGRHFTGIEIQAESAEMAKRSVMLNNLEQLVDIVEGDIKDARQFFEPESFDVVTSNPPYMIGTHGLKNDNSEKAIARHEIKCTLEDIIREGAYVLKPGGRFYMVHRPFRLVEIFDTFTKHKLEPKRMRLVYPYADKEPNMVLLEAVKGGKPRITVEKPLIVYKNENEYTEEIMEIYGKL